jgi:hypothetical protein
MGLAARNGKRMNDHIPLSSGRPVLRAKISARDRARGATHLAFAATPPNKFHPNNPPRFDAHQVTHHAKSFSA